MKIIDLLDEKSIKLNLNSKTKSEAIEELVDLVANSGNLNDKENYKKAILAREEMSTTGIGEGVAIPHAKNSSVTKACIAAAVSKEGIDYESFDGSLSNLFFMIAAPDGANNTHLEVLSRLSTILMDEDFRNKLINSSSEKEFKEIIDKKEREKFSEEYQDEKVAEKNIIDTKENDANKYPKVLAVTACPTGIAHTFMAAESLNKMAENKGVSIKVETNGSAGVKNKLTKDEIENATCIIVAADKNVEMARFNGKKVIKTKVADGIHKAEELIDKAVNGDAPIYHGGDGSHNESNEESESGFRKVYKHLMNGVSNMLPFVIGGGILIAIAFLLDDYTINPSNFGSNTPTSLGFISGFTGEYIIRTLEEKELKTDFIKIKSGFSRINVKIKALKETEINGQGPNIDDEDIDTLYKKLDKLNQDDILILAGSIPSTLDEKLYENIMARLEKKNIKVVVDATKNLLLNVLKYKPFLIKPNNDELEELFGVKLNSIEDMVKYAKRLKEMGAINVLVSMGKDGALLITEEDEVLISDVPKGKVKNSVGAGDSMVAGFISGYLNTGKYDYALKLGAASGSATAFSYDLAKREYIDKLVNEISVKQF
ncbi:PTS system fructose-specific transporter subunit IIABC [Clostridioides difficile]|nr:PTS system fructose-specific transporter subunit IIABC [Clostridioides difficile]